MGRRIVLCGAASKRGGYVAEVLKQRGHDVFGVGLHGPDYAIDFAHAGDDVGEQVFSRATARFDAPPDTLIILSSKHYAAGMHQHSATDLAQAMNVNFVVPFMLLKDFYRIAELHDVEDAAAVLALIAGNSPQAVAFNASKAALRSMLQTVALDEVSDSGTTCVRLFGVARTCETCSPFGRLDEPEEMANVVTYMVEDAPAFMSGTVVTLGGGTGG